MSTLEDPFDSVDSIPVVDSTNSFEGNVEQSYSAVDLNEENHDSSFEGGENAFAFQPSIYGGSDGPILPPPSDMAHEESFALREWRIENAIRLEEKEKKEKEMLNQILEEAEEYKLEFYRKRIVTCENNKASIREREKLYVASQQKFHAEADKNYWKSIAELIPNEVSTIEKKAKKDQEKKPSIVVMQGPKPGKPTDLSRMRQILINLKHDTPAHLKLSLLPTSTTDAKASGSTAAAGPTEVVAASSPTEVVAAA